MLLGLCYSDLGIRYTKRRPGANERRTNGIGYVEFGLVYQAVAFVLSGSMAFAYWMAHAPRGFFLWTVGNGGDAAVLYCFLFLYIAAVGGGVWSLDKMMNKG